jgi:ADP-ribosylglycohydrolase
MRAHPIALGCYGQPPAIVARTAIDVARITHAHRHGITGGLLQTLAVAQVQ